VATLKDGYASCYGDYRTDIASYPGCGFGDYVSGEDFTYTTAICNTWAQKVCGSCYHVECDSGKSPNTGCSGKSVYVKAIDVLGSTCGSTPQSHIFDLNDVPWAELATENGSPSQCSGHVHVKYQAVSCQAAGLVTAGLKVGIMPDQCDPWCPPFWFANVGGAGAIFSVEVSTDGGATWNTYTQNAGNGARWDCPAGNADYRTSALSFRIELCDLAALPEVCIASGEKMTWINELPITWCPPHATNPNICGTTSFQLSSNFGDSVVSTTLASTTVETTTTVTTAQPSTTTASDALVSTVATTTTAAAGICTGEPCPNVSHCRSKWGWCNAGAAYCNDESTWTAQCSTRRLLLARSAVHQEGMRADRNGGSIMV